MSSSWLKFMFSPRFPADRGIALRGIALFLESLQNRGAFRLFIQKPRQFLEADAVHIMRRNFPILIQHDHIADRQAVPMVIRRAGAVEFLVQLLQQVVPSSCGHFTKRCRIVRLGDSRERKKRPHLVKKLNHKSIKEGIQMKQNRIFDQNSSQKARSWHYNMDTNRAEAQFADGSAIAIDCLAIEDEYGNTPAQRAELDWLLYNKPLECVQLVLSGEIEHYLSLGCDHGKLKD